MLLQINPAAFLGDGLCVDKPCLEEWQKLPQLQSDVSWATQHVQVVVLLDPELNKGRNVYASSTHRRIVLAASLRSANACMQVVLHLST